MLIDVFDVETERNISCFHLVESSLVEVVDWLSRCKYECLVADE